MINDKYKKRDLDLSDITAVKSRPKVRDSFLLQIKKFKDEIASNGLLPLVLIFQVLPGREKVQEVLLFGYGQGERSSQETPHRPTISPSLLSKIRIATEEQHLQIALAPGQFTVLRTGKRLYQSTVSSEAAP